MDNWSTGGMSSERENMVMVEVLDDGSLGRIGIEASVVNPYQQGKEASIDGMESGRG